MRATASYLILSTPRSGSNLLCRGLESTNLAGKPKEYFDPGGKFWSKYGTGADPGLYVDRLLSLRASPNGVLGAKVHWRQMRHFERACRIVPRYQRMPLAVILSDLFPEPRYPRITRRHKLRQAISRWKAYKTGVWARSPGEENQSAGPAAFDYDGITKVVRKLVAYETAIDGFCARNGIAPFTVVYEGFADAYEETPRAVLHHLGIEAPEDLVIAAPQTARQAGAETAAWVERYHRITRERGQGSRLVSDPVPCTVSLTW